MAETVKRISVPVLYGMTTILPVTLEMMIADGQAVMRGARAASRVLAETGCSAVKLEGGVEMAETIRFRFSVRLKLPA